MRRGLGLGLGGVLLLCVAGVSLYLGSSLARPLQRVHGQISEALPHTHHNMGEITGEVGYIEKTSGVVIVKLEDGAVVQAVVSPQAERFGVSQRVRVEKSLGHHGETLFTVLGPAQQLAIFGR